MISINWSGRLGNRMIQFAGAWVMSKYSCIELQHKKPDYSGMLHTYGNFDDFFDVAPILNQPKNPLVNHTINASDEWVKENYKTFTSLPPALYNITELMQVPEFLNDYFDEIRSVFIPKNRLEKKEGVLVHCRLGDISVEMSAPLDYYRKALSEVNSKKGYLITDPMSKDHELVRQISEEFGLEIYISSPVETLNFGRGFNEVVVCTGTFGWWLGAFNPGSKILYYKIPREHAWHPNIFQVSDWKGIEV